MKAFLLLGQSNMAGRGDFGEVPEISNPHCFMLRNGRWQPMSEPINPDRQVFGYFHSGVGLAASFADEYAKYCQEDVGLIPCADGGTSLKEWMPGEILYENAVLQTGLAKRTSKRSKKMKEKIFEIKRFAVHDGDGIRTTVFLKGCPLKCVWCHNPEGIGFEKQLSYYEHKCVRCGACAEVCPEGVHTFENGIHKLNREKCKACGKCEAVCLSQALKLYGKEMSIDELVPILLEDREFYENSNGGVTLSGGECLMQADFCAELLKKLKMHHIHTAVDTCGFVSKEAIDKVMPYTDIFLYDLKALDETVHIKCTNQSNKIILENLKYIDQCGKAIEIRIPYVPKYNSDQIEKIAECTSGLKNLIKVRVLPYHNYAGSKYEALGMENSLPKELPEQSDINVAIQTIKKYGIKEVM